MEPTPRARRLLARWSDEGRRYLEIVIYLLRWIGLGVVVGILSGVSSWVFLEGLDAVTRFRVEHDWITLFLPVGGLLIGLAYHYLGGRSGEGNALLIDQIHEPTDWVPRRMAPLVLVGTWATHLFGGSAGREGTALQMAGSLTDWFARVIRVSVADRRMLLVTALAGGFGAVFGVPLAGAVFALEVQSIGRVRYEALVPSLTAAIVGHLVVTGLGYHHAPTPHFVADLNVWLIMRVAVAGIVFGLAGAAFVELTHAIKRLMLARISWPPFRPMLGGVAVLGLAFLFGQSYLGLSIPLIAKSLVGVPQGFDVFALKIVFTAVTLGCIFPGGEVTPLFVVGATLGSALGAPLGINPGLLAAVGFVAVFAGAANVPLACTIMGAELFGSGAMVVIAVGCVIAYVFSSHRGIYPTQRIHAAKFGRMITGRPTLDAWRHGAADPTEEAG